MIAPSTRATPSSQTKVRMRPRLISAAGARRRFLRVGACTCAGEPHPQRRYLPAALFSRGPKTGASILSRRGGDRYVPFGFSIQVSTGPVAWSGSPAHDRSVPGNRTGSRLLRVNLGLQSRDLCLEGCGFGGELGFGGADALIVPIVSGVCGCRWRRWRQRSSPDGCQRPTSGGDGDPSVPVIQTERVARVAHEIVGPTLGRFIPVAR